MAVSREALWALLEPAVAALGFEISDLELRLTRGGGQLRLFIDSPVGVNVDDCESVSRQVSSILDVADPIAGSYSLEVSSPGLDRRLVKDSHFERFKGAQVAVRLKRLVDGRRRLQGALLCRDGDGLLIRMDEADVRVPMRDVDVVRLVPDLAIPRRD